MVNNFLNYETFWNKINNHKTLLMYYHQCSQLYNSVKRKITTFKLCCSLFDISYLIKLCLIKNWSVVISPVEVLLPCTFKTSYRVTCIHSLFAYVFCEVNLKATGTHIFSISDINLSVTQLFLKVLTYSCCLQLHCKSNS